MSARPAIARRRLAYRYFTSLGCALAAAAACIAIPQPLAADATLLDFQIAARARLFPPGPVGESAAAQSPVAVVALDRGSLDAPELTTYPRVFFEPGWAAALTAVMEAGAKAAAFDEIFAYDPNTFPGIGPNFALPFLATLHKYRDRVILARSATTLPARPFAFSVGYDSLGLAEISQDPDGRYRHLESGIDTSAGPQPTLSALALSRAGLTMPASVLVAPRRHLESIPTYSMIDVIRCARVGSPALHDAFGGKIVLFGGTLPEEDRKPTAARFLRPPLAGPPLAACGLRRMGASDPSSNTVPGVFLHAAAVEAVATGDLTASAPTPIVALVAAIAAGLGAIAGMVLAPWTAVGAVAAMAAMLALSTVVALQRDYWIPLAIPLVALVIAPGVAYSMRYLVEERSRRHVQHAFGRYLAPAIVNRLADDPSALKLGGELREITVMFADLTGFTEVSARLDPEALTAAVNRYLGYIVEQVESTEGYVDKFIGDAVMAFWGAPAADPDHALNAVRAAVAAAERIQRARIEDEARGAEGFAVTIGINSGPALVGNVGTEKRYNYTAVGEAVNLASRLESAPDIYSCRVVIGPRTADLVSGEFLLRELDWLLVKGASARLAVYEPIAERAAASAEQVARAEQFTEALGRYRARRFEDAASIWEDLARKESEADLSGDPSNGAAQDNPPAAMARRARGLIARPPADGWDGVYITNPEVNDDPQS
ncbi:MAG: adenylate/guanylate cyclase domain-containing protein [Candidatus Binatales bacterium]